MAADFDAVRPFSPDTPANPFIILILAGTKASHPSAFNPDRYLTPFGKSLYQKAITTECYTAIAQLAAGKKSQDLYDVDPTEADRLLALITADAEIPFKRHDRPIFLAQGTADTVVYAPATTVTADKLRAKGNNLTYKVYPGIDHNGVMGATKPEILAWAADRFHQ